MTMTLIGFLVLLVVAAIAGGLGQAIAGYSLGGCLVSSLVGFIGAFIGLWLAREAPPEPLGSGMTELSIAISSTIPR